MFLSIVLHSVLIDVLAQDYINRADSVFSEEVDVVSGRRSIQHGRIEFISHDYAGDTVARSSRYEIWFQGSDICQHFNLEPLDNDGLAVAFTENSLRSGDRIYLSQQLPNQAVGVPVAFEEDSEEWTKFHRFVTDPRLFGLQPVPFPVLHSCGFDEFVGNKNRINARKETDTMHGQPAIRIEFENPGRHFKLWIDAESRSNLLAASLTISNGEEFCLDCIIGEFGAIKFPEKVTYQRKSPEGEVLEKNVTTVIEADFSPPSLEKFTLVGLDLPKGVFVFRSTQPNRILGSWNGTELVTRQQQQKMIKNHELVSNVNRNSWLSLASKVVLLGLLLGATFLAYRKIAC